MNKSIRAIEACKYLVCAILLTGAAACDKTGFAYDNIVDNGATKYIIIDSATMNMSSVYQDSIPTSNQGTALVGTHTDPVFGTVSASSYWKVRAFSGTTIPDRAVYDSLIMVMRPKAGSYGDSTQQQEVGIYRVTERIQRPVANFYFYSNYSFATESTPLGSRQFTVRPYYDTTLRIKLDDALGSDLFAKCKLKLTSVTSQEQFELYLKGLAMKPGANSALVNSFRADDSLVMRLYYHTDESDIEVSSIDFPMYDASMQFNHIDVTRIPGSPLASLNKNNKRLPSEAANNRAYSQPITQVITRIDMPYLKNISQLHKFFKVMRATLIVRPEIATYQYPYLLPNTLRIGAIDNGNTVTDTLISPSTGGIQTGNLTIDYSYNLTTAYTYDITNYIIAEMASSDLTTRGLAILPPRDAGLTGFNRVILGDSKNKYNHLEIKIYYLQYE